MKFPPISEVILQLHFALRTLKRKRFFKLQSICDTQARLILNTTTYYSSSILILHTTYLFLTVNSLYLFKELAWPLTYFDQLRPICTGIMFLLIIVIFLTNFSAIITGLDICSRADSDSDSDTDNSTSKSVPKSRHSPSTESTKNSDSQESKLDNT